MGLDRGGTIIFEIITTNTINKNNSGSNTPKSPNRNCNSSRDERVELAEKINNLHETTNDNKRPQKQNDTVEDQAQQRNKKSHHNDTKLKNCKLRIRLLDGNVIQANFSHTDTLRVVYNYAQNRMHQSNFNLCCFTYTSSKRSMSSSKWM